MPHQKTFLFISTLAHIPWGGCEDLWYKTALIALDKGHDVFVLVFRHQMVPKHLEELEKRGAGIFWLEQPGAKKGIAGKVSDKLFPDRENRMVMDALQNRLKSANHLSVLVSQAGGFDFCYGYLDRVAAWLHTCNAPLHVLVQNVPDLGFTVALPVAAKQKAIFEKARSVGFVSKRNHTCAERILAAAISNAYTINNPLNVGELVAPLPFPSLDSKISFGTVAALRCFHKGQDVLFQVLASNEWKERNWELNLYGKGSDEAYLHELAEYYHIRDRVHFHGHVSDIRNVWEKNHIHILPSLGEGTPLALIESMYCGRPAVTTDVGGNAEYCEHLVSGFIADYPTPNALARVMELAWEKRANWEEMGKAAQTKIITSYELKSEETLYNKIAKR